jgi:hypothetical protein
MSVTITSVEVSYGRTIKTGDFESARADVKLYATLAEDDVAADVLPALFTQAKESVYDQLGLDKPVKRTLHLVENLAMDEPAPPPPSETPAPRTLPAPARPPRPGNGELATPAQIRLIYLVGRDGHGALEGVVDQRSIEQYGVPPAELTKRQASAFITTLKGDQW